MNQNRNNLSNELPPEIKTILQIVLNSLPSPYSRSTYKMSIQDFLHYWLEQSCPIPNKLFLQKYIFTLRETGTSDGSINLRLAAIKAFAREAADHDVWDDVVPAAFSRVKKIPIRGTHSGKWLTLAQAQQLIHAPDPSTIKGLRDRAVIATLLGCGLRRLELVRLTVGHLQQRSSTWILANILGKRDKVRTVVLPGWSKQAIDAYTTEANILSGVLFRPVLKSGRLREEKMNTKTVERIVKGYAAECGLPEICPHDLRRTYAKLSYKNGARLDQIQINLGHHSLTTTQKYLGNNLDLHDGPGNYLDIKV